MNYTPEDWERTIPASCRTIRNIPSSAFLFRQREPAEAIFLLLCGEVRLLRHLEDGSVVGLHVACPGETLAEAALFSPHYHCDALVTSDARIMVIRKQPLLELMSASPELGLHLTRILAEEVRHLRNTLSLRNIRRADERVMAWLRLRATGNPPAVSMEQTWKTVAEEIGLTHEALYRTLAKLEKRGRIRREPGRVTLMNKPSRAPERA